MNNCTKTSNANFQNDIFWRLLNIEESSGFEIFRNNCKFAGKFEKS